MIPLRDNQATRRLTLINVMLIAANVAVFFYELSLGAGIQNFIYDYAMIPVRLTDALQGGHEIAQLASEHAAGVPPLETIVTSMFLHGGILHLAGNMLYLFIFGAAVEEAMGHLRFLFFYLACGIAAALATAAFAPTSTVPVIGASGAIAGVLGAYFVLYPRAKISTVLPIFVLMYFVQIPAIVYLLIWFVAQLYSGLSQSGQSSGGVAWWAHVGGFLVGMILGPLLATRTTQVRRK
jgi:membrane associated rhomboid family serine protease